MSENLFGFTKIRFTGSVYRPKGNSGTTYAKFVDETDTTVFTIGSNVCPTNGVKEHDIIIPFYSVKKVFLNRHIDTRSDGYATIKIELYDSYTKEWKQILYANNYRTGTGVESISYNLSNASARIIDLMKETVPLKITKDNNSIISSINLTKAKLTNPSIIFKLGNNIYYGSLFNNKPNYKTLIVNNSQYLTSILVKLGSYSISRNHEAGTSTNYSTWQTHEMTPGLGFIHGVKLDVRVDILAGNYDSIGFEAYIQNKYDPSKSIYLSKGWGTGSNWYWGQEFSYTLTESDKAKLGGTNTEIVLKTRLNNNCGSSYLVTRNTFTITTT